VFREVLSPADPPATAEPAVPSPNPLPRGERES
jgi:hypothetical protein